jgi:acetate kinase
VFTGGVGENAPAVRAGAVDALPFLGLAIDPAANAAVDLDGGDPPGVCDIGGPGAPARVLVVAAREDLEIARGVRALLT